MDFDRADESRLADRRMALAREWDELVEQVRTIEGFEDFLRPPPLETLLPAASEGPVVVVNVSQWRCDALVVSTSGVTVVELPDLTLAGVAEKTDEYLRVLDGAERRERALAGVRRRDLGLSGDPTTTIGCEAVPPAQSFEAAMEEVEQARAEREASLHSIMSWLWDAVAEPVLTALGFDRTPPADAVWPRIWWCPTGLLTLLPLHGAGDHAGTGRTVVDRVISSYTPTLRVLRDARATAPATHGKTSVEIRALPRLLVVAIPDVLGAVELIDVQREVDLLTEVFGDRCTVLAGDQATADVVLSAMTEHPWVHFCCHGYQDLNDPSRAGLGLHDRILTLTDLSARQYRGDLAFLAACQTATGGLDLPDEAITLAAALHYTGFRHVVATLWAVEDDVAADVTKWFYEHMVERHFRLNEAAVAVHEAVRRVRVERALPLSEWLPFTHTGP